MNFKKVLISELKPAAYNPRKNLSEKDPEYQRIKKSIETFGYVDPIIVNADYTVIGGHQRLKVLKEMGEASIDVVVVDVPKTQEKALNVALNKISGEWDFSQLSIVLSELKEENFDISITGFSDEELKKIDEELFGKKVTLDTEPQISRAEELRKEWGTELGQMWQCGEHRVICGDCTDPAVVDKLIKDDTIDAVLTDPPYSSGGQFRADRSQSTQKYIQTSSKDTCRTNFNGDNKDQRALLSWGILWLSKAMPHMKGGSVALIFTDWRNLPLMTDALQGAGFVWHNIVTWWKPGIRMQRGRFSLSAEYLLFGSNGVPTEGESSPQNVLSFPPVGGGDKEHIAQKPIELMNEVISVTPRDAIVYDPFLGSGTTMIACENLGRKCRGCEIDPGYVAVILQRYKDTFPLKAKEIRLIADGGK